MKTEFHLGDSIIGERVAGKTADPGLKIQLTPKTLLHKPNPALVPVQSYRDTVTCRALVYSLPLNPMSQIGCID